MKAVRVRKFGAPEVMKIEEVEDPKPGAGDREMQSIHSALSAGLKHVTLRPVIGVEMPLSEAARAHHDVMGPAAYGKIILIP